MTERHGDSLSAYEEALGRGLLAASDVALRPVDAGAIAQAAVAGAPRGATRWRLPALPRRVAVTAVLLLLALAVIGLAAGVGTARPQPLPLRLGHVAYEVDGDVWIADWDGTKPMLVADGRAGGLAYRSPRWSRDGSRLSIFAQSSALQAPLVLFYQADRDGRGIREVGRDEAWDVPVVSPSGSRRAWYGDRSLVVVDERIGRIELPPPAGYLKWNYWDPIAWSPDESRVVLSACTTSDCKSASTHELFSVPLSGAPLTRLTPAGTTDFNGTISPDGSTVAFLIPLRDAFGVGLVGIDGTNRRLIPGQVYASLSSAWAPDSRTIAFGSGQDASPGIRILSVDPNVPPRLLPGTERVGNVLSFSPDGRWILASWIDGPATSLWRVEVDGDTRERLVGGPFDGDWQWLPANDSGASSAP